MLKQWRDWLRGYTDADVQSVWRKIAGEHYPGEVILVTDKELKALLALPKKAI